MSESTVSTEPNPSPDALARTFSDFDLSPAVLAAVADVGYEAPSPIQARSLPVLLEGKDLVGQAQTGTGKTAAFALPLLSRIDPSLQRPQILILTPTRELAIQVGEAFGVYARHMKDFRVLPLYGGQGMDGQLRGLKRGVHVVVGTPGRVMDHLRRRSLKLDSLRSLVLDEADEMLNMGFIEDVEWILEKTPGQRQTALFSATMPEAVRRIARRHLQEPVEIKIQSKTTTVDTITQRFWPVAGMHKLDALTRILETEDFDGIIIFVRTKNATVELAEKIEARGYSAAPLNGDMNQALREKTVDRLKKEKLDILVATDVAARGLNVERVSHVINYDIPYDTEAYVHRIGRTGRAGRKGNAILFVSPRERRMLRAIERATRQPIEQMQLPSRADVAGRRIETFKKSITGAIQSGEDLDFFEDIVESLRTEHDVSARRVAAAIAYLLQRERPLRPPPGKDKPGKGKPDKNDFGAKKERLAKAAEKPEKALPSKKGPELSPAATAGLEMIEYRLEVGKQHGVQAKHIVGAITGESGLDGDFIGPIKIWDDYSTVDLPAGMPKQILHILKKARIMDQKLGISATGRTGILSKKRKTKKSPGPKSKAARETAKPKSKTKKSKKAKK